MSLLDLIQKESRLIKQREGNNSLRGIWIQDTELQETAFQPGTPFTYEVDLEKRQVVIRVAEPGARAKNHVSRHRFGRAIKPLLDIRSGKVKNALSGAKKVVVRIYEETIVVSAVSPAEVKGSASVSAESVGLGADQSRKTVKGRLLDLVERLANRRRVEIVLSRRDVRRLAKAAGLDQLRFDFDSLAIEETGYASAVRESVRHLPEVLAAVSLFSGAGIMDLGFIQAGVDVQFALELDPWAVQTYRRNLRGHVVQADILEYPDDGIPELPIMFGGSPCQDFSPANRRTHGRLLDSPKNRLALEFIRRVKLNRECKVFVYENVPQVLTAGGGLFRDEFLEALSEFEITYGVLDAADYGAPQHRKRAIIIGSKIGRIELPKPTHGPNGHRPYATVGEALASVTEDMPNQQDYTIPKPETRRRMAMLGFGENWSALPPELRGSEQHHSNYLLRLHPDKPSCAIPNWRKALITHPYENRILSVREAAALCSIPHTFEFVGPLDAKQQQVGNCVPVCLARAVAAQVVAKFEEVFGGVRLARPALV